MKDIGRIPHRAELLTVRLITGLIAVEAFFETLAVLPFHLSGESHLEPYRVVTSVFAGMGIPIIGGFLAIGGSLRFLKVANGATAVGHIMILAGWLLLVPESNKFLNSETLWILASGPAIAAAIIAWGLGWGWIVFALTAIGFPIIDYLSSPELSSPDGILDSLKALVFSLGLAAAVAALLNAAKQLDAKAEESRFTAEVLAISTANRQARKEADLLIHDDILSTLTFASGNKPVARALIAKQARTALGRIEKMTCEEQLLGLRISSEEFLSRVEIILKEQSTPVKVHLSADPGSSIPQEASTALLGSLKQALTNSAQHAAPKEASSKAISRSIQISFTLSSVEIVIADSGQGFDLKSVPPHRLGIRKSIVERMNSVEGGKAVVESQVGVGTTITLFWNDSVSQTPPAHHQKAHTQEFGYGRLGILLIAVVFITCHALMAGIRLLSGATPIPSLGALLTLCVAVGLLAKNGSNSLSLKFAGAIVGLTILSALMQFLEPHSEEAPRLLYWYLPGIAAILVLIVLNNYVVLAWVTMGVVLSISVLSSSRSGMLSMDYILVIFRPVLMLGAGTLFLLPMNFFQRKLFQLRAEEAESLANTVFEKTAREERYKNAVFLKQQAGTILQILAQGKTLSTTQILDCISLEGRLRDRSRSERLSQSPLIEEAAAARQRGVDVVLLDDAGVNMALEKELDLIRTWMTNYLSSISEGKFTGRLVPDGRLERATIVIENLKHEQLLINFPQNQSLSELH